MSPALTQEQRVAVTRRSGPLALSANAGSGKTSVLVERYVLAVIEDGVAPSRILAITFTDRAAGELRERVRARLVAAGEREAARESAGAFVSTFHGFCARLLRSHAVLAGRTPDFAVLGESSALSLRDSAFDAALPRWLDDPAALEMAAAFGVGELRDAVGSAYDELRSRGERFPALAVPPPRADAVLAVAALAAAAAAAARELAGVPAAARVERALERLERCAQLTAVGARDGGGGPPSPSAVAALALGKAGAAAGPACEAYELARVACEQALADELGVAAAGLLDQLLRAFGERYDALKRARGVADYDDLELEAGALLAGHEELRALWSERFELLMVDELQDTNARQMAMLAALDRGNLFTVGDEFQSIYGFRHADVDLFRSRRDRLAAAGAASVLSFNFRSRPPLLSVVNGVFAPRFGGSYAPLRAGREEEPATGAPGGAGAEPLVELLVVDSEGWETHEQRLGVELAPAPLWRRAEARLLAARVDRLIASGEAAPEDIVLLFRAGGAIGVYEAALADLGHATLASTGGGFFTRPEIVDLVAYLRALANPLDELALYGVLASPLCGCSSDVLASLALRARELRAPVWDTLAAAPPDARCAAFAERFAHARRAAGDRGLGEIVAAAVSDHGYDLHLASLHSPQRRVANVRKLERLAREFEGSEGRDLRRFAAAVALGRVGSLRETEAPPPTDGTGAIALMTIHSAKGLEFPVVCLADLGHQPGERRPPVALLDGERIGLRLATFDRSQVETLDYAQLRAERQEAAAAEEERVIYVAMTRARERLILSGAAKFARWPSESTTAISWLGPALVADLPARAAAGGGAWELQAAGGARLALTLCTAELAEGLLWPQAPPPADGTPGTPPWVQQTLWGAPEEASIPEPGQQPERDSDAELSAPVPPVSGASAAPGTLSYTAIAEYERCGYRYHLQRIIGLPDVEPPLGGAASAAARGVVAHALLERFDFAAPRPPSSDQLADAARLAGVALDPREDLAALAALVGGFAASPLCHRLAAARDVRREEAFAFELEGAELLRGFLDVVATEPDGGLLIVDFKTDRVDAPAQLASVVERQYGLQRLVYALAGLASGAQRVEVAYCFLRHPELVFATRFPASERPRLERALAVRLRPLRASRFEVSGDPDRERCGSCPGRARLCSHTEEMTLRERRRGGDPASLALD
jgi:ATP-dependent exoDNAse (exonuclease V) beta subunit